MSARMPENLEVHSKSVFGEAEPEIRAYSVFERGTNYVRGDLVPAWHNAPTCSGNWLCTYKEGSTLLTIDDIEDCQVGPNWRYYGPIPKDEKKP